MKVVEAISNVLLVPNTCPGVLALFHQDLRCYLSWIKIQEINLEQSIEEALCANPTIKVPLEEISNILGDNASDTLVLTTTNTAYAILLFHQLGGAASGLAETIKEESDRCIQQATIDDDEVIESAGGVLRNSTNEEDLATKVLDTFATYSNFYLQTAKKLVGLHKGERPIRDDSKGPALNPWIRRRDLDLPPSRRRPFDSWKFDPNAPIEITKMMVFTRGSSLEMRKSIWLCLFTRDGIEKPDSCTDDNHKDPAVDPAVKNLIEKDVFRTDRTIPYFYPKVESQNQDLQLPNLQSLRVILERYALENPDIGYVQGMSDIASPMLFVMDALPDACNVFGHVMSSQKSYYDHDSMFVTKQLRLLGDMLEYADPLLADRLSFAKDNSQMFFVYRWLLLLFKREVGFYQFPSVLETIMCAPCPSYELYIALALILTYREDLLYVGDRFDQTLNFFLKKSGQVDAEKLLSFADQLQQYFSNQSFLQSDPRFLDLFKPTGPG